MLFLYVFILQFLYNSTCFELLMMNEMVVRNM